MNKRFFIGKLAGGLMAVANAGLVAMRLKRRPAPHVRFIEMKPIKIMMYSDGAIVQSITKAEIK